ncbi:MAG: YabP/YqfC family sporulation protein [Clostridia bacterium]|nr:YabP/YqfC family sporulation protein [Clostridia bacterium]
MAQVEATHKLVCDGRKLLTLEGLVDVAGYDDKEIQARTNKGVLDIKGTGLNIERLDKDSHILSVSGTIDSLVYKHSTDGEHSFWKRLFR